MSFCSLTKKKKQIADSFIFFSLSEIENKYKNSNFMIRTSKLKLKTII